MSGQTHISLPVQHLVDWVVNERMTKHDHSSSSPESVKTPASTSLQTPSTSCKGVTPQVSMQKVSDVQSSQEQPDDTHKKEKSTQNQTQHSFQEMMNKFSVSAKKATIIQQSTIEGSGEGLFITELAKDREMLGRYSGKVLSAEEAANSKSKYLLQKCIPRCRARRPKAIWKDLSLIAREKQEGRRTLDLGRRWQWITVKWQA